jgi:hypothetical protein
MIFKLVGAESHRSHLTFERALGGFSCRFFSFSFPSLMSDKLSFGHPELHSSAAAQLTIDRINVLPYHKSRTDVDLKAQLPLKQLKKSNDEAQRISAPSLSEEEMAIMRGTPIEPLRTHGQFRGVKHDLSRRNSCTVLPDARDGKQVWCTACSLAGFSPHHANRSAARTSPFARSLATAALRSQRR